MAEMDNNTFEEWRAEFLADAQRCGRRHNAEQLSDEVLRLFWEIGVAPTVLALTRAGEDVKAI